MIARRAFVMGLASSYLRAGSTRGISLGCQTNAWPVDPSRIDSFLLVLGNIHELEFAGFETGFRNLQSEADHPESARKRIDASGLQFFGVHKFLRGTTRKRTSRQQSCMKRPPKAARHFGAQRLLLSGAPVETEEDLARLTDPNEVGFLLDAGHAFWVVRTSQRWSKRIIVGSSAGTCVTFVIASRCRSAPGTFR